MLTPIALVLASLAGCGGGGTDEPTHAAWVTKANAICRRNDAATAPLTARLEALARTGIRTHRERDAAASIIDRGAPYLEGETADLRNLLSPPEDAPAAAAVARALELKRGLGEELARAFESGTAAEINRALLRLDALERRTKRLLSRNGLGACASTGGRGEV
jgi:hypothetical protein